MSIKKFSSLAEVEKAVNNPNFLSDFEESESPIDIVELLSDTVDCVTDEEDIGENNLDENF